MVAVLFRHPRIHPLDGSGRPATAVLAVDGANARVGDYDDLVTDLPVHAVGVVATVVDGTVQYAL